MDVVGHVLLGAAVTGQVTPYTVAMSLLPDVSALLLQHKGAWKRPLLHPKKLAFYRLCHSPLMLFGAYFLPDPGFLLISTHVLSDMFTHDRPYSDFPLTQWNYNKKWYWALLLILGGITCIRLFYSAAG